MRKLGNNNNEVVIATTLLTAGLIKDKQDPTHVNEQYSILTRLGKSPREIVTAIIALGEKGGITLNEKQIKSQINNIISIN